MRRKNWRLVIAGLMLVVFALVFFLFMLSIASRSNDPEHTESTIGTALIIHWFPKLCLSKSG